MDSEIFRTRTGGDWPSSLAKAAAAGYFGYGNMLLVVFVGAVVFVSSRLLLS